MRKLAIFLGDVALLYGALAITLFVRYAVPFGTQGYWERFAAHLGPFSLIFLVWLLMLYLFNLYQYKSIHPTALLKMAALAGITAGAVSMALFYFFPAFFGLTPKTNLIIFSIVFIALKYLWQHIVVFRIFPQAAEPAVLIGSSETISKTSQYLKNNPHLGYKITENGEGAHLVVVQDKLLKDVKIIPSFYNLIPKGVNVMPFSSFYEEIFESVPLDELDESWFIENIAVHRPLYDRIKRIIDIILSLLALAIFSPFLILSALAIRLTSRGPVLYKQERVGKDNKPFILYKFRTMRHGAKGPLWTEKKDKRLTPAGRILRAAHFDELPQLWNILKGDISVTGPRPERKELVEKYKKLPHYEMRHIVKPGLTGWAQVNFKPSASMEEAKEKLCYDIYYIKNRSLFLDLIITFKTARLFLSSNY